MHMDMAASFARICSSSVDPAPVLAVAPRWSHPTTCTAGTGTSSRLRVVRFVDQRKRHGVSSVASRLMVAARVRRPAGLTPAAAVTQQLLLADEHDAASEEEEGIPKLVSSVREMLQAMGDGAISSSPYDAGWVAMVPAVDGRPGPEFPAALDWLAGAQLPDGSWAGIPDVFNLYDRLACTLACVLALTTWSRAPDAARRGCRFIAAHLHQVTDSDDDACSPIVDRTVGFELVFWAMSQRARSLRLDLPYDAPAMAAIRRERERKLRQIPLDRLHARATTLLASLEGLEGLPGLDWARVLALAAPAGHFLASPASTACVLMHTGDRRALAYLTRLVEAFDGGVPNHYPVDVFERLWVVDRLQRLGVARYFEQELKGVLDWAYRRWSPSCGLSWASGCPVPDLDDTSMGFRLLRQHGYHVSPDVFHAFEKGEAFACWMDHGSDLDADLTPAFNLYRAAQTMFPGETVLDKARAYTRRLLQDKLHAGKVADKWVMAKDLRGELEYALAWPWYASLPRVETRAYIDHYGVDDVWVAKTLYRMHMVQNSTFLALAKADYNMCQKMYRQEVEELQRWNSQFDCEHLRFAKQTLLPGYLIFSACSFEPELAALRRAGTQIAVLCTVVDDYYTLSGAPLEELRQFQAAIDSWDPSLIDESNQRQRIVFMGCYNTINQVAAEAYLVQGRDVSRHIVQPFRHYCKSALTRWEWAREGVMPSWDRFLPVAAGCAGVPPVAVPCCLLVPCHKLGDEVLDGEMHGLGATGDVITRLLNDIVQRGKEQVNAVGVHMREHPEKTEEEAVAYLRGMVDKAMQELVQGVLRPKAGPLACTLRYLHCAQISYYLYAERDGWSDPTSAIKQHIHYLLFQPIP